MNVQFPPNPSLIKMQNTPSINGLALWMRFIGIFCEQTVQASRVCKEWNGAYKIAKESRKDDLITRLFAQTWVDCEMLKPMLLKHSLTEVIYASLEVGEFIEKVNKLGEVPPFKAQPQIIFLEMRDWIFRGQKCEETIGRINHLIDSCQFEILLGYISRTVGEIPLRYAQYRLMEKKGLAFTLKILMDCQPPRLQDCYKAVICICSLNVDHSLISNQKRSEMVETLLMLKCCELSEDVITQLKILIIKMYPTCAGLKTSEAESLLQLIPAQSSFFRCIREIEFGSIFKSAWSQLDVPTRQEKGIASIRAFHKIPRLEIRQELIRLHTFQGWNIEEFMAFWPIYCEGNRQGEGMEFVTLKLIWLFSRNQSLLYGLLRFSEEQPLFIQALENLFLGAATTVRDIFKQNEKRLYQVVFEFLTAKKQSKVIERIKKSRYYKNNISSEARW